MKSLKSFLCILLVTRIGFLQAENPTAINHEIELVELTAPIVNCNFEAFKSGYEEFKSKDLSADEKSKSLTLFAQVAQTTKQKNLDDLLIVHTRSSQGSWPFAKFVAQGLVAAICSLQPLRLAIKHVGGWGVKPSDSEENLICEHLGCAVFNVISALLFAYFAKQNYTEAYHQDEIIKTKINELYKIIAFIQEEQDEIA